MALIPPIPTTDRATLAWVTALYVAVTVVFAYPVSLAPATTLLANDPDAHLYLWTMGWNAHAFATGLTGIFEANIYYPERLTLAYSENLIGTAVFAAPVLWLSDNLVLALNAALLITPVLCGLGAFLLARALGLSVAAAVLCGLVFAFSPARFFRLSQPHVTAVQWVPFMLAFLHAYLDRGRPRDLRLAIAAFSMQALTTGHGAAFALVAIVLLAGWRVALGEPIAVGRRIRDVGLPGLLLILPAALIYLPYRAVQDELGLRRTLVDWAPAPESFLASPSVLHTWLTGWLPGAPVHETATAFLFPGLVPIALALVAVLWRMPDTGGAPRQAGRRWRRAAAIIEIAGVVAIAVAAYVALVEPIRWRAGGVLLFTARDPWRAGAVALACVMLRAALTRVAPFAPWLRLRAWRERWRAWAEVNRGRPGPFYAVLTLVALLLTMGPPLGIWPLVYWLPGLSFIRAPSRFMVLVVLGLAVLSAAGLDRLRTAAPASRRRAVGVIAAALLLIESVGAPLPAVPFRVDPPAVDRWLDAQARPFAVAEVPVYPVARSQTVFMLHATAHWQKTVHGYSGGQPRLHDGLYDVLRGFPDRESLARLAAIGVDYVVVHPGLYEPGEWPAVRDRLPAFADQLALVYEADGDRVYRLTR
ncbi:MAG: hypothetical protein Q8L86_02380 [Vicinamibacterales bacterium]|nr:hypothetical protein [Vicinamibacterales bacterium]